MISFTEQYDGWIKKITRKVWNKHKRYHQFSDLLSVAYVAAVEAERAYDESKAKFSTFVKPRIEGALTRYVSTLTSSQYQDLKKIYKFVDEYIAKHGRVPAQHIILSNIKLSEKKFISLLDASDNARELNLDEIEEEVDTTIDLDTIAEYDKIMLLIGTLSREDQRKIKTFIEDPTTSVKSINNVVIKIRNILGIEDE